MKNYQILTTQQLNSINQQIMKKKNEISDILIKKHPDTNTNGYMNIDIYLEILQQVEVTLSNLEVDHFYALITQQNKQQRILLQQIDSPFDINENEEEDEVKQPQINEFNKELPNYVRQSQSQILSITTNKNKNQIIQSRMKMKMIKTSVQSNRNPKIKRKIKNI
ncbi:unnamed protein product [Paramecium octaurelia]|uniref:Uncharacterized protein n=1 Tax=Paramecium octaurelia TaxID=43137 RepID=A0A8S1UQJ2_PAROT|nr:unnamed protein product [Paramecium octaurelia]